MILLTNTGRTAATSKPRASGDDPRASLMKTRVRL